MGDPGKDRDTLVEDAAGAFRARDDPHAGGSSPTPPGTISTRPAARRPSPWPPALRFDGGGARSGGAVDHVPGRAGEDPGGGEVDARRARPGPPGSGGFARPAIFLCKKAAPRTHFIFCEPGGPVPRPDPRARPPGPRRRARAGVLHLDAGPRLPLMENLRLDAGPRLARAGDSTSTRDFVTPSRRTSASTPDRLPPRGEPPPRRRTRHALMENLRLGRRTPSRPHGEPPPRRRTTRLAVTKNLTSTRTRHALVESLRLDVGPRLAPAENLHLDAGPVALVENLRLDAGPRLAPATPWTGSSSGATCRMRRKFRPWARFFTQRDRRRPWRAAHPHSGSPSFR